MKYINIWKNVYPNTNACVPKLFLEKRSIQIARHTNLSEYRIVTNRVFDLHFKKPLKNYIVQNFS